MKIAEFSVGEEVVLRHNDEGAVVIEIISLQNVETKYIIFTSSGKIEVFESQISKIIDASVVAELDSNLLNAYISAKIITNPSNESLYSLNSAK